MSNNNEEIIRDLVPIKSVSDMGYVYLRYGCWSGVFCYGVVKKRSPGAEKFFVELIYV